MSEVVFINWALKLNQIYDPWQTEACHISQAL